MYQLFPIKGSKGPLIFSTSSSGLPKWRQSPIDLIKAATWTKKYPPLYLTNYWQNEGTITMKNTGKTGNGLAFFKKRNKFIEVDNKMEQKVHYCIK